ncbi:hypothetical protein [Paraflavitalea speifideaquila]|uniref:hypothetical protein n=1 Tax=Paraflavitalea speifideaquila TaxID=3076558 RepID=UPI0028EC4D3F|nr:hypothetical protein [Paraflavitalea speifideiaquila]
MGKRKTPATQYGEVEILLQHLTDQEGLIFNAGRQLSYISQFMNGVWDTAAPLLHPYQAV